MARLSWDDALICLAALEQAEAQARQETDKRAGHRARLFAQTARSIRRMVGLKNPRRKKLTLGDASPRDGTGALLAGTPAAVTSEPEARM